MRLLNWNRKIHGTPTGKLGITQECHNTALDENGTWVQNNDQQLIAQLTADKYNTHCTTAFVHWCREYFPVLFPSTESIVLLPSPLAVTGWMACALYSHCPLRDLLPPLQPHLSLCCRWPSTGWKMKKIRAPITRFYPVLFPFDSSHKMTLKMEEVMDAARKQMFCQYKSFVGMTSLSVRTVNCSLKDYSWIL